MPVMGHDRPVAADCFGIIDLLHLMAGELPAVRSAPRADAPGVVPGEQLRDQAVKADAERGGSGQVQPEHRQFRRQLAPVTSAVGAVQRRRPDRPADDDLRLVGENPFDPAAQSGAERVEIALVGDGEKLLRYGRIQHIDIERVDLIRDFEDLSGGQFGRVRTEIAAAVGRVKAGDLFHGALLPPDRAEAQELLPEFVSGGVDLSAAEAGGPADLVVEPGVESEPFRFEDARLYAFEPAFAHVRCFQPASRVHEESSEAGLLHGADLADEFIGFELVVPAREGNRAVFVRNRCGCFAGTDHCLPFCSVSL